MFLCSATDLLAHGVSGQPAHPGCRPALNQTLPRPKPPRMRREDFGLRSTARRGEPRRRAPAQRFGGPARAIGLSSISCGEPRYSFRIRRNSPPAAARIQSMTPSMVSFRNSAVRVTAAPDRWRSPPPSVEQTSIRATPSHSAGRFRRTCRPEPFRGRSRRSVSAQPLREIPKAGTVQLPHLHETRRPSGTSACQDAAGR